MGANKKNKTLTKEEYNLIDRYARPYAENMSDSLRKEIALNLIKKGVELDVIAQTTSLPLDEVSRIYSERRII